MPTPKRPAAALHATPRSSKRVKTAQATVEVQTPPKEAAPIATPSKTSSAAKAKISQSSPSKASKPTTPSIKRSKAAAAVTTSSDKVVIAQVSKEEAQDEEISPPPSSRSKTLKAKDSRAAAVKAETYIVDASGETLETGVAKQAANARKAAKVKSKAPTEPSNSTQPKPDSINSDSPTKPTAKPRKRASKTADMPALKPRTPNLRMFLGAHVSASGGVQNAVSNAVHIGANSFALFLQNQRRWDNPPLAPESQQEFISQCKSLTYSASAHVLPHGSYLVNLAQKDPEKASQSYRNFMDDLRRCEALGIRLYNFHPGSTGGEPRAEALGRIAEAINRAHSETSVVTAVIENMAGKGNVIGNTFEDLRDIIGGVKDKSRVGVCIDTCHAFAAGYDLRTPEAFTKTMDEFERVVGFSYLKALHLNDSKAPLGSHRDLHAGIGMGFLGLRAFHNVMNEKRFENLPLVLETPSGSNGWAVEIKTLESLTGLDPEEEAFKTLEAELYKNGADERERIDGQVERKKAKDEKKTMGKKRKKKDVSSDEDE